MLANAAPQDNTSNMNAEKLEAAAVRLPSYEAWRDATNAHDVAYQSRPRRVSDQSSLEVLDAQMSYLQAKLAVTAPAQQLMREVAEAQRAIPLAFRLGLLSVIDQPIAPRKDSVLHLINNPSMLRSNEDIAFSDFAWPPNNPLERATQIGSAIVAVSQKLKSRRPTPLANLYLGRQRQNLSIPTMADYYLASPMNHPKPGLTLEEPEVNDGKVSYSLPRIRAMRAVPDLKRGRFTHHSPADLETTIAIPQVEQLTGGQHARKILIGRQALSFAANDAAKREAERIKRAARERVLSPLERRYGSG